MRSADSLKVTFLKLQTEVYSVLSTSFLPAPVVSGSTQLISIKFGIRLKIESCLAIWSLVYACWLQVRWAWRCNAVTFVRVDLYLQDVNIRFSEVCNIAKNASERQGLPTARCYCRNKTIISLHFEVLSLGVEKRYIIIVSRPYDVLTFYPWKCFHLSHYFKIIFNMSAFITPIWRNIILLYDMCVGLHCGCCWNVICPSFV